MSRWPNLLVLFVVTVGGCSQAAEYDGRSVPNESRPTVSYFFRSTDAWFDIEDGDLANGLRLAEERALPDSSFPPAGQTSGQWVVDLDENQRASASEMEAAGHRVLIGVGWRDDGSAALRCVVAVSEDGAADFLGTEEQVIEDALADFAASRAVAPAEVLTQVVPRPSTDIGREFLSSRLATSTGL